MLLPATILNNKLSVHTVQLSSPNIRLCEKYQHIFKTLLVLKLEVIPIGLFSLSYTKLHSYSELDNNNLIINSYMLFIKGIQSKTCMRDNIIAIF